MKSTAPPPASKTWGSCLRTPVSTPFLSGVDHPWMTEHATRHDQLNATANTTVKPRFLETYNLSTPQPMPPVHRIFETTNISDARGRKKRSSQRQKQHSTAYPPLGCLSHPTPENPQRFFSAAPTAACQPMRGPEPLLSRRCGLRGVVHPTQASLTHGQKS